MFSPANGARPGVRKIAILITDGVANREENMTQIEGNLTKAAGIELFAIGITQSIDVVQLETIASPPVETHYYYVDNYDLLGTVLNSVRSNVCGAQSSTSASVSQATQANTVGTLTPSTSAEVATLNGALTNSIPNLSIELSSTRNPNNVEETGPGIAATNPAVTSTMASNVVAPTSLNLPSSSSQTTTLLASTAPYSSKFYLQ